ncbi:MULTISPECIES: hypothetical protein [Streptomyces]|uniref:Uncharacterized protein n=1 Tax=Streptomyces caniscabiei TaxID=2746961 RepID=A0ABU4MZ89_9ACTN|nr:MULTISPECIES: hypothetical protein [Streptomyces]MBE4740583.1 hypothetical protein [Streptomyces caniscabiei]MBE4761035.1 hypothetical protein [Streptomyces caniscabiei]MBE4773545.1 hypothetical protein [Streptomyces caniscabiei]MBE4789777.1 hypothetical protein [Streptomyces caniscabiei]MBE4798961.1 hypothetical protein [Streptomyces caniscabiei]
MTNSSDSTNWRVDEFGGILEISPERFAIVFQVAKELPNISDRVIHSQGCTRADADDFLRILRLTRGEIDQATANVRLRVISESREQPLLNAESAIEIVAAPEDIMKWRRMLEAACASLGPDELFLRSGYREEEVREVLDFLM